MERFNWTLSEQLFGHQYAQEMWLPYGVRSSDWVSRLPAVIVALNDEETRLIGKKPKAAMKAKAQKPSSVVAARSDGVAENNLSSGVGVRYLYQPSKLVGGRRYFFPLVYMATFDGEGVEDILQPKGLLEGDRGYKRT